MRSRGDHRLPSDETASAPVFKLAGPRRLDAQPRGEPFSADPAVDWLLAQGVRGMAEGRVEDAVPLLERAASLAQDEALQAEIHLSLGEIARTREEHGRALAHLREAADLAPRRADVFYQLGLTHAQAENVRAAVEALQHAAALAPGDADVLRALGVALAGMGMDAEADSVLRRAEAARPDDVRVLESLATQHLKMGRFAECGDVLQRASVLAPDNRLVRRLEKETSYLVERAATGEPTAPPPPRQRLRVALEGAAGDVERRFLETMPAAGFSEVQMLNARDLWRDYLAERPGARPRDPAALAGAVELVIARLDFVDRAGRDAVAERHGADSGRMVRHYHDLVAALDIGVFDRRYCSRPHPVEQVGEEASRTGLEPEEVYRALLEDEFREYEETHDRTCSPVPRLKAEEFEDASIEYGSLLTREMMGLKLGRRERVRKRELERVLLVT